MAEPKTLTRPDPRTIAGLAAVLLFFVIRYLWALDVAWINDDFLFLERARASSFLHNLSFDDAFGNAYRPLSRNFYYWFMRHAFGIHPLPYHVASLLVALAGIVLFFFVLRKLFAGDAPALLGALLFAAHPEAATPVAWACGMQDLLATTFAVAAVLAYLSSRRALYPAFLLAAVLSKETAVALPLVLWLYEVLFQKSGWKVAIRRQLPALVVLAAWAVTNAWLPWGARGSKISDAPGQPALFAFFDPHATLLALRSLVLVEPAMGFVWPYSAAETWGQAIFAALALFFAFAVPWPRRPALRLFLLGLAWTVSGVLPLLAITSLHSYYAYYPSLGVALAFTALLLPLVGKSRVAGLVVAAAVAAGLVVSAGTHHHPALLDGQATRRSSAFLHRFESDMRAMHPSFPSGSRCYFWNVPVNIGFQLVDGIQLRVWYADTTLRGAWMNEYRPDPAHPAYFFGHNGKGGMFEIVRGEPDRWLTNPPPAYADCHNDFGVQLAAVGDLAGAETEWRKALRVAPAHTRAMTNLGLALLDAGKRDEGTALLESSVRLDPGNADAWYFLAHAQLEEGRYVDAAASATRFLNAKPDSARAAEMRALLGKLPTR